MRTTQSTASNRRIRRQFGDMRIAKGLRETEVFKNLFVKWRLAIFNLFKDNLLFQIGAMEYSSLVFFRYRWGKSTNGILLWAGSVLTIAIFNCFLMWKIFKFWGLATLPFIIWRYGELTPNYLLAKVHSNSLAWLMMVSGIIGFMHVVLTYCGFNNSDIEKSGQSWLYNLLKRFTPISEYRVQSVIEPTLVALTGIFAWKYMHDIWLASWLWLSAGAIRYRMSTDKAFQDQDEKVKGISKLKSKQTKPGQIRRSRTLQSSRSIDKKN